MIFRAFDRGVTHFDLANNYGPPYGSAELNFGSIMLTDLKNYRDELIISTVPNAQLMSIDELNKSLNRCNIICKPIDPIEKAFNYILDKAEKGAVTIIFGSHYAARSIYKFFEINFDNVTI